MKTKDYAQISGLIAFVGDKQYRDIMRLLLDEIDKLSPTEEGDDDAF